MWHDQVPDTTPANPNTKRDQSKVNELTKQSVEEFLFHQAELLDGKHWREYIALFSDDGVYWMPAAPEHEHWQGNPSIFTEDTDLMTVRMERILHPDAWSQRAMWYTNHIVGNVVIDDRSSATELIVKSRFHLMELRRDSTRHFAGRYLHHLSRDGDSFKIHLQRVDIINAQATFDYVLQVWV